MHRARAGSSVDRALPSGGRSRGFESLPARLPPLPHAARHRLRHASPARGTAHCRTIAWSGCAARRRDRTRRRPDASSSVLKQLESIGPPVHAIRGNVDFGGAAGAAAAGAHGRGRRRADRDDPRRRARRRPPGADAPRASRGRRGRLRPLARPAARGARRLRRSSTPARRPSAAARPAHDGAGDRPERAGAFELVELAGRP